MDTSENIFNNHLIVVSKIAIVCILFPIIIGYYKKKEFNKSIQIVYLFCLFEILIGLLLHVFVWITAHYTSIVLPYLNKWNIHDTNFIGILAHLNHFGILGLYFTSVITDRVLSKILKRISIILFFVAIINYLFIDGFRAYGVFNPTASAIFCFALPLIHFWFLFREDTKVPLNKNPYFWIALGLLIPNIIGLFLHFAGAKIQKTDFILFCQISIGKCIFSIIGHILIAIGFYYARYTKYMPKATTE